MTTSLNKYGMADWGALISAMQSGETFEVDEEVWYYWLEVLPPVYMFKTVPVDGIKRKCEFGFAEGAEPITDFWREGGRFFGRRSGRMNTSA